MSRLLISPVDPAGDEFEAWHAVYRAASDASLGPGNEQYAATWQMPEDRAGFLQAADPQAKRVRRAFAGRLEAGGPIVATGALGASLSDNLDRCAVAVHVDPAQQRQGLGRQMFAALAAQAEELGRAVLTAEAGYSFDVPADGTGAAGPEFCRAMGFRLGLVDVQRVLDLPVPGATLERLAEQAADHHRAYRLVPMVGEIPEEHVAEYARLDAHLGVEAPTGSLTHQVAAVDVEQFRADERMLREQGRARYAVLALAEDGRAAGYTEIVTTEHEPGRAYQWGTLVWPADRGHRLGLALKVANLRLLASARPDLTTLRTWNAESNGPMIAVNEALGFRPVSRLGEFERGPVGGTG